ncbi:MAG TPA: chemotaxis response regulator protein-glutamate methylesterase [Alphaproteobacteria bacterium]|nr:chemotaxis response regulator protein-glutamate methylesterase [Alphaproteobacteria bacterium]HNS45353.1 chemotaxis response regulator protein-glutamate methylesterase [Alphaproteobacteria bacterium]
MNKSSTPIKVMIVDDSAVIRGFLGKLLENDSDFEILNTAANGQIAVDRLKKDKHDIILLDVEMPVMDGLTAIPLLMAAQPNVKIIMCSTLTTKNAETTLKALALGAVECIAKPSTTQDMYSKDTFRNILIHTVKEIAGIRNPIPQAAPTSRPTSSTTAPTSATPATSRPAAAEPQNSTAPTYTSLNRAGKTVKLLPADKGFSGKPDLLAIGSSTGGPNALFALIPHLKGIQIPVIITQHMPPTFTRILAEHIQQQTGITAVEGEENMPLLPGRIHIAPGGYHMTFKKNGPSTVIHLDEGPMENFCRPAVDPMLRSAVKIYGQKIMTVILTGMGQDGMLGAREIVAAGGRVIAQDEATSVVWGMPGAAALDGTCSAVLPLQEIGPWLRKSSLRLV